VTVVVPRREALIVAGIVAFFERLVSTFIVSFSMSLFGSGLAAGVEATLTDLNFYEDTVSGFRELSAKDFAAAAPHLEFCFALNPKHPSSSIQLIAKTRRNV